MITAQPLYLGCAVGEVSCPRPVGLVLVASKTAVNIFGLATRYTARVWLPQVEHAAEEVARELVSRAVKTTGLPDPHARWTELEEDDVPLIEVRLWLEYPSLFIEVWDCDSASPFPAQGAYLDDHLTAVHEQARRWNWYRRGGGKVIWAELGTPAQRYTSGLSRRTAGGFSYPDPERPIKPLQDVGVMRRVHDGLVRLDSDEGIPG